MSGPMNNNSPAPPTAEQIAALQHQQAIWDSFHRTRVVVRYHDGVGAQVAAGVMQLFGGPTTQLGAPMVIMRKDNGAMAMIALRSVVSIEVSQLALGSAALAS